MLRELARDDHRLVSHCAASLVAFRRVRGGTYEQHEIAFPNVLLHKLSSICADRKKSIYDQDLIGILPDPIRERRQEPVAELD